MTNERDFRFVNFGGYVSTFAYFLAATIKIFFGLFYQSTALYTDGLNSTSDVISTAIILIGLFLSRKPQDEEHKYGHYRIEQIATLLASFIMFFIGIESLIEAVKKFFVPELQAPNILAAGVASISIVILLISAFINRYIAKKTKIQSAAVIAKHNISDVFTAVGAVIAIITSQWNLAWIDPLVSIIIACIILYTAFDIFKSSSNSLIDGFDTKNIQQYRQAILAIDGVEEIIDIKGRMLGNFITLDVTINVDSKLTVGKAHIIADKIESVLKYEFNITYTHVHIEPYLICNIS